VERNKLETRNRGQDGKRSLSHTLRVLEMAGRVIGDFDWKRAPFARTGGSKKLAHVPHSRAHAHRPLVPLAIVLQEMTVLLHDCPAAGRIDRDELRPRPIESGDVAPSQGARGLEITGVCVERAAATLPLSGDYAVPVHLQDPPGCTIRFVEQPVHYTAAKRSYVATLASCDRRIA